MPEISVIVSVYNCEKYIRRCIESILNQTFEDLELLIIDDGSTDESGRICDEFKLKDSRVKVIHERNSGVSIARNVGINIAKGKFIGFVDGDDYLAPDMYESLYKNLQENNADIAICGIMNCFLKELPNGSVKEERALQSNICGKGILSGRQAFSEALKSKIFSVNPVNKLFAAKFLKEERFPANKTSEDAFLIPKILAKAKCVVYDTEPKYYYVRHSGSITTSEFKEGDWSVVEAYEEHLNAIKNNFPELLEEAKFRYFWSYIYVLDKMIKSKAKVRKQDYRRAVNFIKKNFKNIISNPYFSSKRKIAVFVLMISEKIYKKLVMKLVG